MADVFLNGRFVARDEARVSAFDAGLQHGVGLFETLAARVSGGEAFVRGLDRHVRRLAESARALGLSESLRVEGLADAVVASVERAGHERARVRVTVTGGDLNWLARARGGDGGGEDPSARPSAQRSEPRRGDGAGATVLIDVQVATEYPAAMFEDGVTACVADARVNPFNGFEGHKTLNYWWRLRELQLAASKRAGEALVFTITNHLAGGCVSNAFVVKGGELWTPIARGEEREAAREMEEAPTGLEDSATSPARGGGATASAEAADGASAGRGVVLPSAVLPGVTRAEVMEYAVERGMAVRRRMVTVSDVLSGDEVFLTNSSWGVLPVVGLEAAEIGVGAGRGRVGEVTRWMRARWLEDWEAGAL